MLIEMPQFFNFIILVVFTFFCQTIDSQTTPPCGFENIVPSKDNPYVIPAISDNLEADPKNYVWSHALYGNVNKTASVNTGDGTKYISAYPSLSQYNIAPNNLTKYYTRNFGRILERTINVYCNDDVEKRYPFYFIIPFQDMTPPTFNKESYDFAVSTDWDKTLPISLGQFIIATDNAFEIENMASFIKFTASSPDYIRVEPVPLWVGQNENYSYRLDLYFQQDATLVAGVRTVKLIAQDEFSSSDATIQIEIT